MMSDKQLMEELKEKAMGMGFDARYLILELIKRYQIRCFEVEALTEGVRSAPETIPQSRHLP